MTDIRNMNALEFVDMVKKKYNLFTLQDISEHYGLSPSRVSQWVSKNVIPPKYLKKEIQISQAKPKKIITETAQKGGGPMGLQERLIENQLDQIDELTKQNAYLQDQLSNKPTGLSSLEIERYAKELNSNLDFAEISQFANQMSLQWDYVFDNIQMPISIARKGTIRNVNKSLLNLLGFKKNEMVGKLILDFIHPDDKEKCIVAMKNDKRNGIWRCKKVNGKYTKINIKAQSFGNEENKFSLALMECVDKGCPDSD